MAVAPSSNLLSALSQLQGNRPTAPAQAPRSSQSSSGTQTVSPQGASATQSTSFAAQLSSVSGTSQAASARQQAPVQQGAAQTQQSRPVPTRGGYLGQHVNIVV